MVSFPLNLADAGASLAVVPYKASCARGPSITLVFLEVDTKKNQQIHWLCLVFGAMWGQEASSDQESFVLMGLANVYPIEDTWEMHMSVDMDRAQIALK